MRLPRPEAREDQGGIDVLNSEKNIPISLLHELLSLDAETGNLYWRERSVIHFFQDNRWTAEHRAKSWNRQHAGQRALACVDKSGHLSGRIFGVLVYSHRVVFAMSNGYWPILSIDHINGNPSDNRPGNLRDVSHQENHRNQRLRKNNTTGVVGVTFNRRLCKWAAHITIDGIYKHLGFYVSKEDATLARKASSAKVGFHANHGRKQA
jgi:hypothetical protein